MNSKAPIELFPLVPESYYEYIMRWAEHLMGIVQNTMSGGHRREALNSSLDSLGGGMYLVAHHCSPCHAQGILLVFHAIKATAFRLGLCSGDGLPFEDIMMHDTTVPMQFTFGRLKQLIAMLDPRRHPECPKNSQIVQAIDKELKTHIPLLKADVINTQDHAVKEVFGQESPAKNTAAPTVPTAMRVASNTLARPAIAKEPMMITKLEPTTTCSWSVKPMMATPLDVYADSRMRLGTVISQEGKPDAFYSEDGRPVPFLTQPIYTSVVSSGASADQQQGPQKAQPKLTTKRAAPKKMVKASLSKTVKKKVAAKKTAPKRGKAAQPAKRKSTRRSSVVQT